MKVNCQSPVTVVNPQLSTIFYRFNTLVCPTNDFFLRLRDCHYKLLDEGRSVYFVFPVLRYYGLDSKLDTFLVNTDSGETANLFVQVPCGHCAACLGSKVSGIRQRLKFAAESFDSLPLFVTLTYNNEHLPLDGVCKRDVQLFKKRFSKLVYQLFQVKVQYAVFSEYGKLGRPHYHLVVYGVPILGTSVYQRWSYVCRLVQYCWRAFPKKGYKQDERCNFVRYVHTHRRLSHISKNYADPYSIGFVNVTFPQSTAVFYYISKYVSKSVGDTVPEGKNPNFWSLSFNMGVDFVQSRRKYILDDPKRKLVYKSRLGDKVFSVSLSSYYIRKLFPSLACLVPLSVRRAWIFINEVSHQFIANNRIPKPLKWHIYTMLEYIHNRLPIVFDYIDTIVDSSKFCKDATEVNRYFHNVKYPSINADLEYFNYSVHVIEHWLAEDIPVCQYVDDRIRFFAVKKSDPNPQLSGISYSDVNSTLVFKSYLP